jgi:hypothetical protein
VETIKQAVIKSISLKRLLAIHPEKLLKRKKPREEVSPSGSTMEA